MAEQTHLIHLTYDDEEARPFQCRTCKTTIIAGNRAEVQTCPFCHAPVYLSERLGGEPAPTSFIPFAVNRKIAAKALKKWHRGLKFAKKDFGRHMMKPDLVGLFIPVQLYDTELVGEATVRLTKKAKAGEPEEVIFQPVPGTISATSVPVSISKNISQKQLLRLGDYRWTSLKTYQFGTLNDFYSEKYRFLGEEANGILQKQLTPQLDEKILAGIEGYEHPEISENDYHLESVSCSYILVPVWLASYDAYDSDYLFLMNGQTGKLACYLPISKMKAFSFVLLVTVFLFIFLRIMTVLLGGPLL